MTKEKKLTEVLPKLNFFLGIIVSLGGLIGYFKAGSLISFSMGLFFGNLLMLSIWGTKEKIWGFILALTLSIALSIIFVIRFIKTGSAIPALIILPMTLASIAGNGLVVYSKLGQIKQNKSE